MPTDKAIDALCKDPARAARLAAFLLSLGDADWTAWELTFLTGTIDRGDTAPLSYRQAEKLLELEDRSVLLSKVQGLAISSLIRECWALRFELDPEDEAWIDGLNRKGTTSLRRGTTGRLLACLRQADPDLIEGYVPLDAPTVAAA
jgi:hypothetical protein